jgi:hypothetical protein
VLLELVILDHRKSIFYLLKLWDESAVSPGSFARFLLNHGKSSKPYKIKNPILLDST